jgi:hypothetical protein
MTNIEDLRTELLGTLKDLRNREAPMEPDRARAIAQVAGVLVDTARVEIDFIKATDAEGSGFIPMKPAEAEKPKLASPIAPGQDHRTHRLK